MWPTQTDMAIGDGAAVRDSAPGTRPLCEAASRDRVASDSSRSAAQDLGRAGRSRSRARRGQREQDRDPPVAAADVEHTTFQFGCDGVRSGSARSRRRGAVVVGVRGVHGLNAYRRRRAQSLAGGPSGTARSASGAGGRESVPAASPRGGPGSSLACGSSCCATGRRLVHVELGKTSGVGDLGEHHPVCHPSTPERCTVPLDRSLAAEEALGDRRGG